VTPKSRVEMLGRRKRRRWLRNKSIRCLPFGEPLAARPVARASPPRQQSTRQTTCSFAEREVFSPQAFSQTFRQIAKEGGLQGDEIGTTSVSVFCSARSLRPRGQRKTSQRVDAMGSRGHRGFEKRHSRDFSSPQGQFGHQDYRWGVAIFASMIGNRLPSESPGRVRPVVACPDHKWLPRVPRRLSITTNPRSSWTGFRRHSPSPSTTPERWWRLADWRISGDARTIRCRPVVSSLSSDGGMTVQDSFDQGAASAFRKPGSLLFEIPPEQFARRVGVSACFSVRRLARRSNRRTRTTPSRHNRNCPATDLRRCRAARYRIGAVSELRRVELRGFRTERFVLGDAFKRKTRRCSDLDLGSER